MISARLRRRASISIAVLVLLIGAVALLRSCAGDDNLIGRDPEPGLDFDNQTNVDLVFYSVNPRAGNEVEFLHLEPHSGAFENPTFDSGDRCLQTTVRVRLLTGELIREIAPGECSRIIVAQEEIPTP